MGLTGSIDPFPLCDMVINEEPDCGPGEQAVLTELEFEPGVCRWECVLIQEEDNNDTPFGFEQNCDCLTSFNPKKPGGRVTVEETQATENNELEDGGIKHVKIKTTRRYFGFLWRSTDTDEKGCWNIDKIYDVKRMKLKVVFRDRVTDRLRIHSARGVRFWNAMLKPVKHKWRLQSDNRTWNNLCLRINQNTEEQRRLGQSFSAATVNNAVHEFYDDLTELPEVDGRLQILLNNWSGAASAPMFNVMGPLNYSLVELQTLFQQFQFEPDPIAVPFPLWEALWTGAKPDIFLPLERSILRNGNIETTRVRASDVIKSTVFHELTHASQFEVAGQTWYSGIIDYIVGVAGTNQIQPYGDGTLPGAGLIEIAESQAFSIEHITSDAQYGLSHSNPGLPTFSRYINLIENRTFWTNRAAQRQNLSPEESAEILALEFLPEGLVFDLYDENGSFPDGLLLSQEASNIVDMGKNITLPEILLPLESAPLDVNQYKDIMWSEIGSSSGNNINDFNALFSSYGF